MISKAFGGTQIKRFNFYFAASQRSGPRTSLSYGVGSTFSPSESEEDLSTPVGWQTSEVNSDKGTLDFSLIAHLGFA